MYIKILRLLLLIVSAVAINAFIVTGEYEVMASGNCDTVGIGYVYRYNNTFLTTDSWNDYPGHPSSDVNACVAEGQGKAITACGNACAASGAVARGAHGVAYCVASWGVYWDQDYAGGAQQQYDCGDVYY